MRRIILASQSLKRKKLLAQIGLKFEVQKSFYKEDMQAYQNPIKLAKYLALQKAQEVAKDYEDAIIISADTIIILDGKAIGKPKDKFEAKRLMQRFSGRTHTAISGLAVIDSKNGRIFNDYGKARVTFKRLGKKEIENYIATGEPFDKAGGYGLMDRAAVFIQKVNGDFYSVSGIPLNKLYLALKDFGVDVLAAD